MNAWEFDAVVLDGSVYCTGCLPAGITVDDAEVQPIFANEEWDAPAVCDRCGFEHDYMSIVGR
jgi:hypothetical protein